MNLKNCEHIPLWYIGLVRLLFVADGRSPTALSWLSYWVSCGDEVHLISTYECGPIPGLASFNNINVAFSGMSGTGGRAVKRKWVQSLRGPLRIFRSVIGPLTLREPRKKYLQILNSIKPEIVHALRIPYEGLLAQVTPKNFPLIISIWGNDITLHAKTSPIMANATRKVLRRADALFADTRRDLSLGKDWGLSDNAATLAIPGGGGVQLDKLTLGPTFEKLPEELPDEPIIVNPRGQRPGSLRQDVYFHSIKYFIQSGTRGMFICPSLKGDEQSQNLIARLGIQDRVILWPKLTQGQLWSLFSQSLVYASPSIHDGTPNSMLEAMALGCFPVTGNIESMREWIVHGQNGLLINANNAREMADALIQIINNTALRLHAIKINMALVAERANYQRNMKSVRDIYTKLAGVN